MRTYLIGLTGAIVLGGSSAAVAAEGVPQLDHVFVIVLENHNAFTSFGANGILDNRSTCRTWATPLTRARKLWHRCWCRTTTDSRLS